MSGEDRFVKRHLKKIKELTQKYEHMSLQKKIQKELAKRITGHPSQEDAQKIKRLEKIVLDLAKKIDENGKQIKL